jgi:hypothetical protein
MGLDVMEAVGMAAVAAAIEFAGLAGVVSGNER